MKHQFFSDVFGEFGGLTNRGWLVLLAFGLVMAGADLLAWSDGPELSPIDYASVAITAPLGLFAAYFAGMSMASRRMSGIGYGRFVACTIALFLPLAAGIATMLALLPDFDSRISVIAALTFIFLGWLTLVFLPAWPIAQALSSTPVSPMRLLRGTKGHRWSLFLVSSVSGSLNNLAPSTSKAKNVTEALTYAVGNAATSVLAVALLAALSVTAWRYAARNDEELYGDEPRAAGVI